MQDIWQARYQILLIIILKKFVKLNVNTNTMIKNVKFTESNSKIETAFNKNVYVLIRIMKKS